MSRYRKVDPRIWNDARFRALDDQGKLVFFFLLTHPHMTSIGAMRASIPGLAAEIGWHEKAFREAFTEVLMKGMAEHDESASLVWLPNFLKYNPPESPNVIKAWAGALDLLPECGLLARVIAGSVAFAKGMNKGFAEALPKAFAKGMPYQEQEQEQEQEQKKDPPPPPKGQDEYTPEFEKAWSAYPKREGGNPKTDAWKAWKARTREGVTPEEMAAGVLRYAAHCAAKGKIGTEFVMQAVRFFGKSKHYAEAWGAAPTKPKRPSRLFDDDGQAWDTTPEGLAECRRWIAENEAHL